MFRRLLYAGVLMLLVLTGCSANAESTVDSAAGTRTAEILALSRAELSKQASYSIESKKEEKTTYGAEEERKENVVSVVFNADYIVSPFTVHMITKNSEEDRVKEQYISEEDYHEHVTDGVFIKMDAQKQQKEKLSAQKFVNPYDWIDHYLVDPGSMQLSEQGEQYVLSIETSTQKASESTRQVLEQEMLDMIKLSYILDKETLLPQEVKAEFNASSKSELLQLESVSEFTTTLSNYNGVQEIVMPEAFSEQ
ncbi:hypothetical protein GCM10010912_52930 [Paenibacillus albidus]|uniref:Uncharacterized protein n=1 Tax=Paenibacillus albidus TaxID=2041023 RepID=A0A917CYC7_9BACL|nr:DUF6612 family protein [Paenibacillus albidus]GGG01466.1 hypothetical protein GCM10010912_52930 [Paenibacillus albidus]